MNSLRPAICLLVSQYSEWEYHRVTFKYIEIYLVTIVANMKMAIRDINIQYIVMLVIREMKYS